MCLKGMFVFAWATLATPKQCEGGSPRQNVCACLCGSVAKNIRMLTSCHDGNKLQKKKGVSIEIDWRELK